MDWLKIRGLSHSSPEETPGRSTTKKKQVIAWKLEDLRIEREVDLMACEWAERGKESERSNRLTGGVMRCRLEQRHPVSCCSNHFTAFESSLDLGEIALWNQFLPSWNVRRMSNVCYFPRAFYTPWKTNASVDLKERSVAIQHPLHHHQRASTNPPNANLRPWLTLMCLNPPPETLLNSACELSERSHCDRSRWGDSCFPLEGPLRPRFRSQEKKTLRRRLQMWTNCLSLRLSSRLKHA